MRTRAEGIASMAAEYQSDQCLTGLPGGNTLAHGSGLSRNGKFRVLHFDLFIRNKL